MIKSKLAVVLATVFAMQSAFAHSSKEECHFLPENSMNIPVGASLAGGGLSEQQFNKVIDEVMAVYTPIIASKGGKAIVNRKWNDGTVNANARHGLFKRWVINMYGGLARHPITTEDGFALVLCHELGHHLGGYPQVSRWASNEGQADYFAAMKCFRRVYEKADNAALISSMAVPATMKAGCSEHFKSQKEIDLCVRAAMGGQVLANLLNSLSKTPATISVDTPDMSVVTKMDDAHPAAQCRMDTYFAGSICPVSYTEEFGQADATTGACAMEKGDKFGFRPLCWYKPKN